MIVIILVDDVRNVDKKVIIGYPIITFLSAWDFPAFHWRKSWKEERDEKKKRKKEKKEKKEKKWGDYLYFSDKEKVAQWWRKQIDRYFFLFQDPQRTEYLRLCFLIVCSWAFSFPMLISFRFMTLNLEWRASHPCSLNIPKESHLSTNCGA